MTIFNAAGAAGSKTTSKKGEDDMKRKLVGMVVMAMVVGVFVVGKVYAATSTSIPGTTTAPSKGGEEKCKDDELKICPYAVETKGNRIECLKARQKELSPVCSKWVDRHHEVFKAREKACAEDYKKMCSKHHDYLDKESCLEKNMASLAGDCKATFNK